MDAAGHAALTTVLLVIGGKDRLGTAAEGHAHPECRMRHVVKVCDHQQCVLRLLTLSDEGQQGKLGIAAVDPLEAIRIIIQLPEGRLCLVYSIQILYKFLQLPMHRILQQIPFNLLGLGPLIVLSEILSHKEELLSRMGPEIAIGSPQVFRLLLEGLARHLSQHAPLAVYHLVMREHQLEILGVVIDHGEGQLIVASLPEEGIRLHIGKEVVHPAHVPLQVEAQAVLLHRCGDMRPCRRLLRDQQCAGKMLSELTVQMLQEFHGLQILIAAVDVPGCILSLPSVVQIQHGRHRIHADTVCMIDICPEEGVCNQEVADLVAGIIEDQCAPVRMGSPVGIRILVERRAVKLAQSPGIPREVGRYPVQNDTDVLSVKIVYKVLKIRRTAVTGGGGIVAGNLVAPGFIQRMLHHRHQLHMRISFLLYIFCKLRSDLPVIVEFRTVFRAAVLVDERLLPQERAEVQLIDRHGLLLLMAGLFLLLPGLICPGKVTEICHNRCRIRPQLKGEAVWIRLQEGLLTMPLDFIFVQLSCCHARNEELENTAVSQTLHHMPATVPEVEITHHRYPQSIGRPDSEGNTGHAIHHTGMCTQLLINSVMCACPEAPQILLRKYGCRSIGICSFPLTVVVIGDQECILRQLLLPGCLLRQQHRIEARLIAELHLILPSLQAELYLLCGGHKALDQQSLLQKMGPQDPLRLRGLRIGHFLHIRPVHHIIQLVCHNSFLPDSSLCILL